MNDDLQKLFDSAKEKVTSADVASAVQSNLAVTAAYSKNNSTNQPLVMVAHNLKGEIY